MFKKFVSYFNIPVDVWAVSIAAMLISVSAAMSFSVGPFFMTKTLGLSLLSLGMLDGLSELFAQFSRLFSGIFIDKTRKKKPTLILGFVLAAISKPFFIMANGAMMIAISKVIERISNGVIATPRDTYVATAVPESQKGKSVGLMMTMKTIGISIGSFAVGAALLYTNNYGAILWGGFITSIIAIVVLYIFVKDQDDNNNDAHTNNNEFAPKAANTNKKGFKITDLKNLGIGYWTIVAVASIYFMARFSDGFLIVRYKNLGGSEAIAASLIGIFNIISALCCFPIGYLSDKLNKTYLMGVSFTALILCNLLFLNANTPAIAMIGVIMWGVQRGTTQVLFTSIIVEESQKNIVGSALGMFYLTTGVIAFLTGGVSGTLANKDESLCLVFEYGLIMSILSLVLLFIREKYLNYTRKINLDPHQHKPAINDVSTTTSTTVVNNKITQKEAHNKKKSITS